MHKRNYTPYDWALLIFEIALASALLALTLFVCLVIIPEITDPQKILDSVRSGGAL